jgi:uncharacterized Zn-finger protein
MSISNVPPEYLTEFDIKAFFNGPPENIINYHNTINIRPFACPYTNCTKRYKHRGDLTVHVKKHHPEYIEIYRERYSVPKSSKKEKNYLCPYNECPCGYIDLCGLQRHMKTKHRY